MKDKVAISKNGETSGSGGETFGRCYIEDICQGGKQKGDADAY